VKRVGAGRFLAAAAMLSALAVLSAQAPSPHGSSPASAAQGQAPAGTTPATASQPPSQAGTKPAPAGQDQTPANQGQQPPTFRAGINFVRVDVIATDKDGNLLTDLKATDFDVTEDGKPQTIDLFKLVNMTGLPAPNEEAPKAIRSAYDEESEAARDDVRLFAIFLDDYHVRRGGGMRTREPLANFVIRQLGPRDMVAIMYPLTPVTDLRFTRDFELVANAIQKFDGRKYDYTPRNQFEEQYAMYPADTVERIRNEVTMSALKGLAVRLGSLREGRKAIILVSEGFSGLLPPQLRDPSAAMPGVGNRVRNNPFAGENNPLEDSARFMADADLQMDLREVYDTANKNNTAIYTVDPRGLAVSEFDISQNISTRTDQVLLQSSQDTLRELSSQTDGRAIVNQNDLDKGLKQVVRDTSGYYLLGYNSTQAPADGKFHEIKVRVKRAGVQVRARKGYWALTAEDAARALAPKKPGPPPAVERALAGIERSPRSTSPINTWVGLSRGDNGRTRVTFVWEPLPAVPGVARVVPARVSMIAAGGGQSYFKGPIPAPTTATDGAGGGAGASTTFEVAPGRLELRLSIEDAQAHVLDTDVREIQVPDLSAPKVFLSTPQVLRARTVLEYRAFNADPKAVPTASRDFRRTERLLIRFDVSGPGGTPPKVTARLLNRGGKSMSDLPIVEPAAAGQAYQIDLPLASLPSGEYLIEIKATGDAEAGEAQQLIAIRVGS
jgi:VWFA-related protein